MAEHHHVEGGVTASAWHFRWPAVGTNPNQGNIFVDLAAPR
jgi:hypothetical protein